MNITFPLTIYFDASCRLCNSEMQNIKVHDTKNQLVLIDCSAPEFDDTAFHALGITREHMMNRLHAKDADGNWLIGVAAFEVIYQTIGIPLLANLWGSRFTRPWAEKFYPWVADNRLILSKLGFPVLFEYFAKRAARRADSRSRSCTDGSCSAFRSKE